MLRQYQQARKSRDERWVEMTQMARGRTGGVADGRNLKVMRAESLGEVVSVQWGE
jgi:hypothetical protein